MNHQDIMTKTQSFQMSIDELKVGFSEVSDQKLEKSVYEKTTKKLNSLLRSVL